MSRIFGGFGQGQPNLLVSIDNVKAFHGLWMEKRAGGAFKIMRASSYFIADPGAVLHFALVPDRRREGKIRPMSVLVSRAAGF